MTYNTCIPTGPKRVGPSGRQSGAQLCLGRASRSCSFFSLSLHSPLRLSSFPSLSLSQLCLGRASRSCSFLFPVSVSHLSIPFLSLSIPCLCFPPSLSIPQPCLKSCILSFKVVSSHLKSYPLIQSLILSFKVLSAHTLQSLVLSSFPCLSRSFLFSVSVFFYFCLSCFCFTSLFFPFSVSLSLVFGGASRSCSFPVLSLFHTDLIPHQKLLRAWLSTPITPFILICTISSELSVILD